MSRRSKGHESFVLYDVWYTDVLEKFTDEQLAALVRALFLRNSGESPDFSDTAVATAFQFIIGQISRDAEKYQEICDVRADAARRSAAARASMRQQAQEPQQSTGERPAAAGSPAGPGEAQHETPGETFETFRAWLPGAAPLVAGIPKQLTAAQWETLCQAYEPAAIRLATLDLNSYLEKPAGQKKGYKDLYRTLRNFLEPGAPRRGHPRRLSSDPSLPMPDMIYDIDN